MVIFMSQSSSHHVVDYFIETKKNNQCATFPAVIHLFKVSNGHIRTMFKIFKDTGATSSRSCVLLVKLNRFHPYAAGNYMFKVNNSSGILTVNF